MYRDRDTEAVLRNIFDSLTKRLPDGEVEPMLATDWRAIDELTFEFDLREGVTFHNGEALTADDVVFTFERILTEGGVDGQTSPRAGLIGPLSHVEKVDDYTVRFVYQETFPQALVLQGLTHFQIVPKDHLEEVGVAAFMEQPIGSGPFRWVQGELDSQIRLERYDGYWAGTPPLQTVVFRMMPEPSTRIAALLAGEVHIIHAVPPDLVDRIDSVPGVSVHTGLGTRSAGGAEQPRAAVQRPQHPPGAQPRDRLGQHLRNIYQNYATTGWPRRSAERLQFREDLEPFRRPGAGQGTAAGGRLQHQLTLA